MSEQRRSLILIAGTSGSGKGTIIQMLRERHPEFVFPVSYTTRAPRPQERDGVTYHFVSKERFEQAIAEGLLLEWAVNHEKEYYGVLRSQVEEAMDAGNIVVREISMEGIRSLQQSDLAGRLWSIFLLPPSLEVMRERIQKRSPLPEEEILRRLDSARREMEEARICDVRIEAVEGAQENVYRQVEEEILRVAGL